MSNRDHIRDRVRGFIDKSFRIPHYNDDDSFLITGLIDSRGVMDLMTFVQGEFGITMGVSDRMPANWDSVSRIVAFIQRKQQ